MKKYKTRIGIENLILLALICILNLYLLFELNTENFLLFFVLILILFCPIIITWIALKSTTYTITENYLLIQSSFFYKKELQIKDIKKIEKVTNIIKSPAGSIKRLELFYGKYESVMISPQNEDQFLKDLLEINNEILKVP